MKAEYAYIGIKSCGCCIAATVDDSEHREDVASDLHEYIKAGYHVDRVKIEDARIRLQMCKHGKPTEQELLTFSS